VNESVVFHSHVLRGLGFPVSDFFRGFLHHWGIQVNHLTPNSILHISILFISAKPSWGSNLNSIYSNISFI
jgi:hypothetical protein